jgi:hypothetical protein
MFAGVCALVLDLHQAEQLASGSPLEVKYPSPEVLHRGEVLDGNEELVRRVERSNKIIWETVQRVGERVGVRATVHSLRRSFAVAFLTSHPGAIESLQALMNHSRIRYDSGLPAGAELV